MPRMSEEQHCQRELDAHKPANDIRQERAIKREGRDGGKRSGEMGGRGEEETLRVAVG